MKWILFTEVMILLIVSSVSAHSLEAFGQEINPHSGLGNAIFSLVIGVGLVYLIVWRTYVDRKNGG